jgi:hypothetical protein
VSCEPKVKKKKEKKNHTKTGRFTGNAAIIDGYGDGIALVGDHNFLTTDGIVIGIAIRTRYSIKEITRGSGDIVSICESLTTCSETKVVVGDLRDK